LQESPATTAVWQSEAKLRGHFRTHGRRLRTHDVAAYDASARRTIASGRRFTYTELEPGDGCVGYFDPATGRFTALSNDEVYILTHFRASEGYIRRLLDSDH
jgi:hypothetical protein